MEDMHPLEVNSRTLSPASSGDINPPSIGANQMVTLKPGETLILYHPHSQCPMRIIPTVDLHGPTERTIRHDIRRLEDSYAPFPTRADFEQTEIFINDGCSDKHIDKQLKFQRRNGMALQMKTAREMHALLARGVGEDVDDSMVGSIYSALEILHF